MRYLTLNEVLLLHERVLAQSGGLAGMRAVGGLESALAQPRMTFGGQELYPTIVCCLAAFGCCCSKINTNDCASDVAHGEDRFNWLVNGEWGVMQQVKIP